MSSWPSLQAAAIFMRSWKIAHRDVGRESKIMKQLATVIGWVLMGAGAVVAQRVTYSTHDWSGLNGIQPDCWADVVTPGSAQGQSGITYSVGTTIIGGAPLSTFSGDGVMAPAGLFGFTGSKQVVVLQKSDPSELDGIEWQAYFFGRELASVGGVGQSATARAISVWPAATQADTRIAICGSSFDPILPSSGSAPPDRAAQWSSASPPAGFIAVYDGGGGAPVELSVLWARRILCDYNHGCFRPLRPRYRH